MSGRCDDEEADIVKRLLADGERPSQREARILLWEELKDAADEIKRLREALRYYAKNHYPNVDDGPWGPNSSDFGDVARAALGEDKWWIIL